MSTVAIRHPHDPKRPTVIRAELYDERIHELWVEPKADDLPDDLPGRAALLSAGFVTMHGVVQCDDFGAVPGIGETTERRLRAYLARPYGVTDPETAAPSPPDANPPTGPVEERE